jgi:hypothetical protein
MARVGREECFALTVTRAAWANLRTLLARGYNRAQT